MTAPAEVAQQHNASTYVHQGCRCETCRSANTERQRQMNKRRKQRNPPEASHGRASCYTNWGCRCVACCAAHSVRMLAYRQRRKEARAQA